MPSALGQRLAELEAALPAGQVARAGDRAGLRVDDSGRPDADAAQRRRSRGRRPAPPRGRPGSSAWRRPPACPRSVSGAAPSRAPLFCASTITASILVPPRSIPPRAALLRRAWRDPRRGGVARAGRERLPGRSAPGLAVVRLLGASARRSRPRARRASAVRPHGRSPPAPDGPRPRARRARRTSSSTHSACSANETSITAAGMALRGGQVDHPTPRQQVQPAAVAELVLLDQRPHLPRPPVASARSSSRSSSTSKCPALASTAPSFIRSKCSPRKHPARAGDGHEDVPALGGLERRHHLVAGHPRLERAQRVDLADDHRRPGAARALGDALARPAVADDHDRVAGQQHVAGADDPVERRLAGPVAVVERALGAGLVDREHRAAPAAPRPAAAAAAPARWSSPRCRRSAR